MGKQHILLSEDRPNLQYSLGLMLKQAEYRVSLAATTEEAVVIAGALAGAGEAVDLLIIDLDSASEEACSSFIQTLSASAHPMPYLVLAEDIRDRTKDILTNHGCLACITKPFEPATLLRSVNEALDRLRKQDARQP